MRSSLAAYFVAPSMQIYVSKEYEHYSVLLGFRNESAEVITFSQKRGGEGDTESAAQKWRKGQIVTRSSKCDMQSLTTALEVKNAMAANYRYEVIIYWSDEDQAFVAEVPELEGCAADGATYQEAISNVQTIIEEWIETAQELGRPIPEPKGRSTTRRCS